MYNNKPVDNIGRLQVQNDHGHDGSIHVMLPSLLCCGHSMSSWKDLKITTQVQLKKGDYE